MELSRRQMILGGLVGVGVVGVSLGSLGALPVAKLPKAKRFWWRVNFSMVKCQWHRDGSMDQLDEKVLSTHYALVRAPMRKDTSVEMTPRNWCISRVILRVTKSYDDMQVVNGLESFTCARIEELPCICPVSVKEMPSARFADGAALIFSVPEDFPDDGMNDKDYTIVLDKNTLDARKSIEIPAK